METLNTTQIASELEKLKTEITQHQEQISTSHEALRTAQTRSKELTQELCRQLGVSYHASKTSGTGKTRNFSPEALERIRAGQRARWAKYNANKAAQQQQTGNTAVASAAN
jgi:Asp-tRNA(Asn)/Glu-tRNA(Gln) amidotransferase A subunit family amidase